MKCPACSYLESKVIDSRPSADGLSIRRRRECLKCHKRFTTYETIENATVTVIKKDGSVQVFDRNKVLNSIIHACDKRLVTREEMEGIVSSVESALQSSLSTEITSAQLGEMVMERLKSVDEVAYIRFASVYRRFTNIDDFKNELSKLQNEKKEN